MRCQITMFAKKSGLRRDAIEAAYAAVPIQAAYAAMPVEAAYAAMST